MKRIIAGLLIYQLSNNIIFAITGLPLLSWIVVLTIVPLLVQYLLNNVLPDVAVEVIVTVLGKLKLVKGSPKHYIVSNAINPTKKALLWVLNKEDKTSSEEQKQ